MLTIVHRKLSRDAEEWCVAVMVNARGPADAFHNSTKHGTAAAQPDRLVAYRRLDPDNAPDPFKRYRDLPSWPLPRTLVSSDPPAVNVLSGDRGDVSSLDSALLATLLYLMAGVTRTTAQPEPRRTFFRAAMSAGNLHPIEVYVVAGPSIDGLAAGVHHFAPRKFALTRLREGDFRSVLSVTSPAALVLTGLVWRTTWKYAERGWRHLFWDAGTMLANLVSAADAHGLDIEVRAAFDDTVVGELIGVDGVDEVPAAVVALGPRDRTPPTATFEPEPITAVVDPVAPHPVRLPLLVDAQLGSAMNRDEIEPWRQAANEVSSPATERAGPRPDGFAEPIEQVILRRGSTRMMRRSSITTVAFRWSLTAASRAVPLDAAPRGTLLEHFVNVHAVDGVRPGAYRWDQTDLHFIAQHDSLRAAGAVLCLNQPLGGESAYTAFHHAHLGPILDALGSRGYRAAQLEAGIVSGRLALCAFAVGLGATGLTFFDDLVSDYFDTTASPMLVTAVGVPDRPPAPYGTPGEPAALTRHAQLTTQVSFNLTRRGPRRSSPDHRSRPGTRPS